MLEEQFRDWSETREHYSIIVNKFEGNFVYLNLYSAYGNEEKEKRNVDPSVFFYQKVVEGAPLLAGLLRNLFSNQHKRFTTEAQKR